MGISLVITVAQIVGGIISGSLALLSDAFHTATDAVVSIGVILGGLAIMVLGSGYTWIDPLLTAFISVWLIRASWSIVSESMRIIMMSAPPHIDIGKLSEAVTAIEGVRGMHHLHLWSLNDKTVHFEAHIDIDDRLVSASNCLADEIEDVLHDSFGISHATLQFECNRCRGTRNTEEHGTQRNTEHRGTRNTEEHGTRRNTEHRLTQTDTD